jgi:hypothetical protein
MHGQIHLSRRAVRSFLRQFRSTFAPQLAGGCYGAAMLAAIAIGSIALPSYAAGLYAPAPACELERAGCPQCVSRLAVPVNGPSYVGYFVGGGAWTCGSCRCSRNPGTWGWDYQCRYLKPIVRLGWWAEPHSQGGTGSYEPDGPRFCPE